MNIQVMIFRVVKSCSDVEWYEHFGGSLSGWRWKQHDPRKRWHSATSLNSVTIRKTATLISLLHL